MSRKHILVIVGLIFLAVFVRVYNLEKTSRFIWDESRALVDMHRIWEKHQLTFVGPISEDNLEMFPSLTYYLHLPTTVLSKFDPLGPVWTDVVLGVVLWLVVFTYALRKIGIRKTSFLIGLLMALSLPFVQTSRWFWNPNQIPFWTMLSLICIFSSSVPINLLGGVFLGLNIYHHYLSLFMIVPLLFGLVITRKTKKLFAVWVGTVVSFLPIIVFELKNHYYLSWFRMTSYSDKHFFNFSIQNFWGRLGGVLQTFSDHFVTSQLVWITLFYILLVVLLWKLRHVVQSQVLSFVLIANLFLAVFIDSIYPYYLYSLVPIVLLQVIFGLQQKLKVAYLIIVVLIIFGAIKTNYLIITPTWQGDIQAARETSQIVTNDNHDSINIAALNSPDPNTKGQRYRDLVLISGKQIRGVDQYPQSQILYVVTTKNNLNEIRQDQAWEFQSFRGSKLTNTWQVSSYPYYLFRFEK